jgi:predicted HTH transcriptional regulator
MIKSREKTVKSREKTVKSREKIIELLAGNGKLSAVSLATIIGISPKAVEKHLSNLKSDGIIERTGPDKGGRWIVIGMRHPLGG